jgi:hypothetical protein
MAQQHDSHEGSLPVSFEGGGLRDDDRLTRGAIVKCVDGIWSVKNDPAFKADAQFLAMGTASPDPRGSTCTLLT